MTYRLTRRLTRPQQIRMILKVLKPMEAQRDDYIKQIARALDLVALRIKMGNAFRGPISGRSQKQVNRYRSVLARMRTIIETFDPPLKRWFWFTSADVEREINKAEVLLAPPPPVLSQGTPEVEVILPRPKRQPRYSVEKAIVAEETARLLRVLERPIVLSRISDSQKIAAILFGDEGEDFLEYLRRFS